MGRVWGRIGQYVPGVSLISMRTSIAALLFLVPVVMPRAAVAAPCSGEACSALTASSDGCAWTNAGARSVRLAMSASAAVSPVVIVLAPGETFKAAAAQCATPANDGARYEASFPVLRAMPDDSAPVAVKVAMPVPKAKPMAALVAVAAAAPAVAPVAPVAVAAAIAVPRAKPAAPPVYPPLPRLKPAAPVEAVAAVAPAGVVPDAAAPVLDERTAGCGDLCGEIMFKVVESCVWVQSQNPRPIAFEASVGGKAVKLRLEGASAAKADVRAAVLAKAGAEAGLADGAYHTRLQDPFQSAGAGIPVYRVRLGGADACVKSREEITTFAARYVR